ncbi:MAG: PAS domain S-box protein [Ignavibacteria bacterium]|nr:PAS domain S-box protein [Ignavibacteria bacterium]
MTSSLDKTFGFTRSDFSFRNSLEHAPIGILIFGGDFVVKYVNKNFFLFEGVVKGSSTELIGRSIYEYRIFEGIDLRKDLNDLRNGTAFEKELLTSKTLSGNKINIIVKCVPIYSSDEFNGGIIVVEDVKITSSISDAALLHSAQFNHFLLLLCDMFMFIDSDGTIKTISPKKISEYAFLFEPDTSKQSSQPQKISKILFKQHIDKIAESKATHWIDIPYVKDSTEQRLQITLIPLPNEKSKTETIIVLVKNVSNDSELKTLADEEIKELRRYQQIVANVVDGVIGINEEGKIIFWNETSAHLFGLTRSEVYGKFIGKIFTQITVDFFSELKNQLKEKKVWQGQFKIGEDENIAEFFSVKIGLLLEENSTSFYLICSNITENIRTEKNLKQSEEKFRNIVTSSHEFICTLDASGKITYANPNFMEVFQYSIDELLSLNIVDLIEPNYLQDQKVTIEDLLSSRNQNVELTLYTKLGLKVDVLGSFSAIKGLNENIQYYNVIFTDITLKKESEKDLLLIRSLFEASHDGIALISKRKYVLVNDSFVRMFGFNSASEIIGLDPLDFVVNGDIVKVAKYIEAAEAGKETNVQFEFTGKKRDNNRFEVENSVSVYETNSEKFIVWVLRDVTEKKEAQAALQKSEERYRSISESINESFWTAERIGENLKAVFYSPAIKKITGYSYDAFIKDQKLWKKIIHPDDVNTAIDMIYKLYTDSARNFEAFEYRIIDSMGNVIWIENKITVKRNSKGEIQKIFGVVSDISITKKAEVELKKSADELKEMNETKDRFISIISHDLRTPFSSILGFTDFLLTEKDLTEDKRMQYIHFIQDAAKSMLGMVNSLLDWTRLQTGRIKFVPERINAKLVLDKSVQILSGAALQKKINLISEVTKDIFIHADDSLLLQVFNNLLSNAIKFTNEGGQINVSAKADIDKQQIQFSVRDNGIGMRKEDLNKLFKVDTKFTTPGTSGEKGSGLGLSLVNDIIKKHGGEIWVTSEVGKGSNFIFTIPVSSTNILLVDDMNVDRMLYTKLIKSLLPNYNVIDAENGKKALEIIKSSSPALVITDHKMPIMSGYDLVKQLSITDLKYRPPVIILSSDITAQISEEYKVLGVEFIFQKPVNLTSFKSAIDKSLRKAIFS